MMSVIRDVDARVQEVFSQAYEDTAREFMVVFSRLFPGGEARMILTEPNDLLNSGVEIEARGSDLTVTAKKSYTARTLAERVGIKIVSPKANITMTVASSSKKNCAVVAAKLKTLKAGQCVVTFTVQEPKSSKGKQPKASKTVKTLVIQKG